ncbi:MAG TPA: alpha/beta fold hydrolase [Acidimicrobiales bacterium]|nr:alpha/beta fold hydrolase [Acidimicrobiales bacterium]
MDVVFRSGELTLRGHLAEPPATAAGRRVLILCHGFPAESWGSAAVSESYPDLADRLAAEAGWTVMSFDFRGAGRSEGNFSLDGWRDDLRAAIEYLAAHHDAEGVWLAGFSTGGALALCAAGEGERVRGVATFAAPADFDGWAHDARRFLEHARNVGVIKDRTYPEHFDVWAHALSEIRPLVQVPKIPPRALLIVHGADDDVVPVMDARALADAADGDVELRVLNGAGHRLRHDPRAIAVLIGWLDRQSA